MSFSKEYIDFLNQLKAAIPDIEINLQQSQEYEDIIIVDFFISKLTKLTFKHLSDLNAIDLKVFPKNDKQIEVLLTSAKELEKSKQLLDLVNRAMIYVSRALIEISATLLRIHNIEAVRDIYKRLDYVKDKLNVLYNTLVNLETKIDI